MAQKIQIRRATEAQWATANPILAEGEPGLERDTRKVKYGDGVTAWNALPYASGTGTQGIQGIKGDKGDQGDQGVPGNSMFLILGELDPVPEGTPNGTFIGRTPAPPPEPTPTLPQVMGIATTSGVQSEWANVINTPAGVEDGEWLFAFLADSDGTSVITPDVSGWTVFHEPSYAAVPAGFPPYRCSRVYGRYVADASALPSTFTFTSTNKNRRNVIMVRVAGLPTSSPVEAINPLPTVGKTLPSYSVSSVNCLTLFTAQMSISATIADPSVIVTDAEAELLASQISTSDTAQTRQKLYLYSTEAQPPTQPQINYTASQTVGADAMLSVTLKGVL